MSGRLPSELIKHTAQFFDSAADLLSFSLVSKQFHNHVLAEVRNKNNAQAQALVNLFLKKEPMMRLRHKMLWGLKFCKVLPNGARHGKQCVYLLTTDAPWSQSVDPQLREVLQSSKIIPGAASGAAFPSNRPKSGFNQPIEPELHERVWQVFVEKGALLHEEVNMFFGVRDGKEVRFNTEGKVETETSFVNGLKHGDEVQYVDDGGPDNIISITSYRNGKKHGLEEFYYLPGLINQRRTYENDDLIYEEYFMLDDDEATSSTLNKTTTYTKSGDGHLSKVVRYYYPSGALRCEENFVGEKQHGLSLDYHENGVVAQRRNYNKDLPSGLWQKFDEDGKLILENLSAHVHTVSAFRN